MLRHSNAGVCRRVCSLATVNTAHAYAPPVCTARADLRLADSVLLQQLTQDCWGLGEGAAPTFVAVFTASTTEEEQSAFTVSSEALAAAVALHAGDSGGGVEALVCIGGGNPPGVHNTQNPAPVRQCLQCAVAAVTAPA